MMRIGLGILLILVSAVMLFGMVVVPVIPQTAESRTVDDYLQLLLCQPNERLIREQYHYMDYDGTGFSMTVYCESGKNQRVEVTDRWILFGIIAFVVPFLIGLFMLIFGINSRAAKTAQQITSFGTSGFGSSPNVVVTRYGSSSSPIEGVEIKDNVLKVGGVEIPFGFTPDQVEAFRQQAGQMMTDEHRSLAARLKEIQDARDAGLISTEEYDRLRQEILDNMG